MRNSSKRGSASEPAGKARKPPRARLDERLADAKKFLLPTYKREPVVMTHGQGAYVFDSTGKKYLDFLGGIAVNALGHAHSRIVKVIRREAGESAATPARKHRFLALENSFHGRTFFVDGAAATEKYRLPFAPLVPGVEFVRFNDAADLEAKF